MANRLSPSLPTSIMSSPFSLVLPPAHSKDSLSRHATSHYAAEFLFSQTSRDMHESQQLDSAGPAGDSKGDLSRRHLTYCPCQVQVNLFSAILKGAWTMCGMFSFAFLKRCLPVGASGSASGGAAAWLREISAPDGRKAEMTGMTKCDSQLLTPVLGSRSPSIMP